MSVGTYFTIEFFISVGTYFTKLVYNRVVHVSRNFVYKVVLFIIVLFMSVGT